MTYFTELYSKNGKIQFSFQVPEGKLENFFMYNINVFIKRERNHFLADKGIEPLNIYKHVKSKI